MPMTPTADADTGLGTPGECVMHLVPTAPGNHTFHLKGAVQGTPVDETVTARDTTFDEVRNSTDAEWPNEVPSAAELATRIDERAPRIDAVQGRTHEMP